MTFILVVMSVNTRSMWAFWTTMAVCCGKNKRFSNEAVSLASFLLTIAGAYPDTHITSSEPPPLHYPLLDAGGARSFGLRVYNPILTNKALKSVRGRN